MTDWVPPPPPDPVRPGLGGITLGLLRGLLFALTVFGGLAVLLLIRLVEAPAFGKNRPLTPWITQGVCRTSLWIIGLDYSVEGTPMASFGALVSNHVGWLDILALNACQRIYFVSKSEVAGWPAIGWLARATGTVFIRRERAEARRHAGQIEDRLRMGHRLLFFPEGTSTDGRTVIGFKSTLFAAFFADGLGRTIEVQPVSLVYHAPRGLDRRFYGWWGDMDFARHLWQVLTSPRQGRVEVIFHAPLAVKGDRKTMAARCEQIVRETVETRLR